MDHGVQNFVDFGLIKRITRVLSNMHFLWTETWNTGWMLLSSEGNRSFVGYRIDPNEDFERSYVPRVKFYALQNVSYLLRLLRDQRRWLDQRASLHPRSDLIES